MTPAPLAHGWKGTTLLHVHYEGSWDDALALWPDDTHELLEGVKATGGVLPAQRVEELCGILGAEMGSLMIKLLPVAAQFAIVPISGFRVGAVSMGMPIPGTGWASLYLGANVEFLGQALSYGVHGEQSATMNAWLNGEQGLQALAISAAPCGYCRQFLYELVTEKNFNILLPTGTGDQYTSTPLSTFLPDAFGPHDLGINGGLMDPKYQNHNITLNSGSTDPVVLAALGAAQQCYAPYTEDYSGCAVQTSDGQIYPGRYAENAAYNPSMSPMEAAITFMNMTRPEGADRTLQRAVLVEVPSKASQKSASTEVLSSFSPNLTLDYEPATSS